MSFNMMSVCSQVAGTVAADTLQLGNITVKNQGFGLVLSSSSDFLDISCDGLFVSLQKLPEHCRAMSNVHFLLPVSHHTAYPHAHVAACSFSDKCEHRFAEDPNALQGLGFPAISNLQTTPAFFNMLNDGSLDQPLFSIYMNPDASKDPAGELSFGMIESSKYVGKLSYAPVTVKK